MNRHHSSRRRYLSFVEDYKQKRLDDQTEARENRKQFEDPATKAEQPAVTPSRSQRRGKRREYLREYLRWLWPHRYAAATLLTLALIGAALQMVEPLFMRYIVDRVLLNAALDRVARVTRLNLAGALFLALVIVSNFFGGLRDYRQRLLNARVMLSLRRSLFERLLHLALPKLWDMKTGGILSRLTGDVETTTGLMQMAIVSPALSIIRLLIAVGVLLTLNWRLALTAMAVIPGAMLMIGVRSFNPWLKFCESLLKVGLAP